MAWQALPATTLGGPSGHGDFLLPLTRETDIIEGPFFSLGSKVAGSLCSLRRLGAGTSARVPGSTRRSR